MRRISRKFGITALTALSLASIVSATLAAEDETESPYTAYYRALYYQMRRAHPPGTSAAVLRLQAYEASVARSKTAEARAIVNTVSLNESWQNIGPATISGGQTPTVATPQSRSDVSGRVSAIAIDPLDGANGAVYVGGAQGGVWKSLDGGNTWTPLTDTLSSLAVGTIVVAPGTPSAGNATVYYGTGEGNNNIDGYYGVGIYISNNSGTSWNGPFGSTQFTGAGVTTIAIDSANTQHLLAGSATGIAGIGSAFPPNIPNWGIYNSTDGGQTWTLNGTAVAQIPVSVIAQDPNTPTTWWAAMRPIGTGGGLLKSTDNGATWNTVDGVATGLPQIGAGSRTQLSLNTSGGQTEIYFGTSEVPAGQANNYGGTLYVSIDGGATWTHLTAADGFCQTQCFYDMPIYTPPGAPLTVYTGGAGSSGAIPSSFMVSTDGGTTFTDEMVATDGNSALHGDMHAITTWPSQTTNLWVGNDGGAFHSNDGGLHWLDSNTNLQLTQFEGCSLDPTNSNSAYGGTQDNGTEAYQGNTTWVHSDDGDGGFALIDQGTPTNVTHTYFNVSGSQILATTSNMGVAAGPTNYNGIAGFNNHGLANGINGSDKVLFYAPMALDPVQTETLYFGTDHLYIAPNFFAQAMAVSGGQSTLQVFTALNGGASLSPVIPPNAGASGPISYVYPVPSVPGPATTIYVGTAGGVVWESTDSGNTFTQLDTTGPNTGVPFVQEYVSGIVTDPNNPNIVVVARSGFSGVNPTHNLRISLDGGNTWNDASNGLPDIPINAVVYDPLHEGWIWAGTDLGVYVSTDDGASWAPFNMGFPNVAVFSMVSNKTTHHILACTHGRGAFELTIDDIFNNGFEIF